MTRIKVDPEDALAHDLDELDVVYVRQAAYAKGRKFKADFLIAHNGQGVLVEVQGGVYDGRAHGSISGILKDIERLNLATLNGYMMLRFTPEQVEDGTAKAQITKLLGVKG